MSGPSSATPIVLTVIPTGVEAAPAAAPDPAAATVRTPAPMQDLLRILHDGLAEATDEAELLAVVVRSTQTHQPSALRLFYFHYAEQKAPVEAELVAIWPSLGEPLPPGLQTRFPLAQFDLAKLAVSSPDQALVVPEIATDPRLSEHEKQRCAASGCAALVILPCYSRSDRIWQGVLPLWWPAAHQPTVEELFFYNLIARMITTFIANRRALLAHTQTLHELKLINEASIRLAAAQSADQALLAVATPFIERGVSSAIWSTLHLLPDGSPDQVEVIAYWQPPSSTALSLVGRRFTVASAPLSAQWIADPENPVLVSDIRTDERLDASGRALMLDRGRRAVVVLPLRTRGRWVGTITFTWNEPQLFTSRDQAMCKSLASQAAIVFDNRQLMDGMQDAVREHQRQSLALKALLDYMPVGVFVVEAPTGKPQILNPMALQILGGSMALVNDRDTFDKVFTMYAAGTDQPLATEELPLGQTLADGQPHQREVEVIRPDGTRLCLELFSGPILDESGVMRSAMSLFVDVSERKRAESARVHIQDELISFQAAALAERSTPLIPISDEILVLPLIGSLDTERGQQILDVLLSGVSQSRTRVAIIDVTGVRTLDTQAAQTLTQAAQALRLLGVEPVLTGIRAEVAQTLVSLGVPLAGIVTRSTLQSGIAYANRIKSR